MKRIMLFAVLLPLIHAVGQTPTTEIRPPAGFPSAYDTPILEIYRRFQAVENTGNSGFYWLDTARGDLWRLDPETKEWIYLGNPRGADSGPKGTYQLLSDRRGGVYVLNTDNGEGWWTDGSEWKSIGDLSRRAKPISKD